jgi:Fe2+ transport system protein B
VEQHDASACAGCPAHIQANLIRLGVNMEDSDYVVALAGNPNTGKSTVFNALTGLRQHTGNWPGKTVARAEGGFAYGGKRYKVVDLPGTYSLLSASTDEEIARNFILFGRPDVTVVVADATRLERNLNLVLQVLEITDRTLARELGVPVVPTAARQGEGVRELLQSMHEVATGEVRCRPHRIKARHRGLEQAVETLASQVERAFPGVTNARWVALRLLEGDAQIVEAVRTGELSALGEEQPSPVAAGE